MLLLFIKQIVLGLSIAAPIGPINIEIIRRGLYQGVWSSLLVGAGGMTSDIILMFLMYQGISKFLMIDWIQLTLLIFGAIILTYTGVLGIINRTEPLVDSFIHKENHLSTGLIRSYLTGVSIAAFNPLNILFWLGIYGSILSDSFNDDDKIRAFYVNSAVFIGIGLWNLNLALTVHYSKSLLNPKMIKLITLTASLVLLGFGLHFGYQVIFKLKDMILQ